MLEEAIELKISLPVTVSVESSESEVLYEYTQTLFRNFNPAKVASATSNTLNCQRDGQDGEPYECVALPAQEQLYQQVRDTEGISIIPPKLAVSSSLNTNSSTVPEINKSLPSEHLYQPLNVENLDDISYEPLVVSPTPSSSGSDVFSSPTREPGRLVDVSA